MTAALTHIKYELSVLILGLGVLLLDLWMPPENRRKLGWLVAGTLAVLFVATFLWPPYTLKLVANGGWSHFNELDFSDSFISDDLGLFFKRLFLLAGAFVAVMSVEYSSRFTSGVSEYFSLQLFALAGMLFAASANDFAMLFVSIELITVSFYILTSFERNRQSSLEA